ncbi:MAG TPA: asparagine synthase (glutamine-hydrolyzing) [Thermoanaerobaculia bacterium]
MCGVAGFLRESVPVDAERTLSRMLNAIAHRGPDGCRTVVDRQVAFGACRLAIVDPAGGAQPMRDPSGRYLLAFNGEAYNHRALRSELSAQGCTFRGDGDTEVVLHAWARWGPACLPRLNGPFALALWDALDQRLFLARDRFGKRPLFWTPQRGGLLFASEIKGLLPALAQRPSFDPEALATIFGTWTPLPGQSCFKDVRQVPPGTYLEWGTGGAELRRYATLDLSPSSDPSPEDLPQRIREQLERAVALRLDADVEVGVYLSGGIDSSAIASIASRLSPGIQTFSVEFTDAIYDESAPQRAAVSHLGTRHSALTISDRDLVDAFPAAVFHAEVPSFRTAFVPMYLLSRHARAHGVYAVLTGEGADEVFFGYSIFRDTILRAVWADLGLEERRERLGRLYPELAHFGAAHSSQLMGLFQQYSVERLPGLLSHEMRLQNGRFATRLLASEADPAAGLLAYIAERPDFWRLDAPRRAQWLEFETLLAGYLLSTQGDRMSLAHGVENRCPFLDPEVVALGRAIDLERGDERDTEKATVRAAFADSLPPAILGRRKHPYRAPGVAAFQRHRPEYLEIVLSEAELSRVDVLDARFAGRLARKVLSSPIEQISTQEEQAFCLLLSTVLLHRFFVRGMEAAV